MSTASPPSLPSVRPARLGAGSKVLIALAAINGVILASLILLRVFGLLRPFSVPTGAMTPAIVPRDHVLMEGFTFLTRKPQRGDIIVFATAGIQSLPHGQIYVKRVAGEPGEHLRLSGSKLFINDKQQRITNELGEIAYALPEQLRSTALYTDLTIPPDQYFVLGDNSTNSLDSRFFGCVPARNVLGRTWICYWPLSRSGLIK